MRPYILAETNWKSLKSRKIDLAVLPWGATEAHNLHLPYGTDIYESASIAQCSGKIAWEAGAKIIILPEVPFGVNTGQADILLDLNLNPSTQYAIINDLVTVLNRQGIRKLLVLNSHGGNDFKTILRELGLQFPDMLLTTCNWFQSLDKTKYFKENGDHADEMETSLIMHLHPELVLPLDEAGQGKEKKHKIKAFRESWAWAERRWSQVTDDTGVGNPLHASPEKGEKYLEDVCRKISQLMIELAMLDQNDMYSS